MTFYESTRSPFERHPFQRDYESVLNTLGYGSPMVFTSMGTFTAIMPITYIGTLQRGVSNRA